MNNQPPPSLNDAKATARKGHQPQGRNMGEKKTNTSQPKRDQTPAYKPLPPGMEKAKQVGQVKPLATMSINAMKAAGMNPLNHIPKSLQDDIADYADHSKDNKSLHPDYIKALETRALDPQKHNTEQNLTRFFAAMSAQQQIVWIQSLEIEGSEEWVRDIIYNGAFNYVNLPPAELTKTIEDEKRAQR